MADRIGHANMAYTLAIYTHKSTGKDRGAAETVAGVLLGAGWQCFEVQGRLHRHGTRRRAVRGVQMTPGTSCAVGVAVGSTTCPERLRRVVLPEMSLPTRNVCSNQ